MDVPLNRNPNFRKGEYVDRKELQTLPPEERDQILNTQVDLSLITDALNMSAHALHGIINAELVEEVTSEDLNDAETSLPKATEALSRIKERLDHSREDRYRKALEQIKGVSSRMGWYTEVYAITREALKN